MYYKTQNDVLQENVSDLTVKYKRLKREYKTECHMHDRTTTQLVDATAQQHLAEARRLHEQISYNNAMEIIHDIMIANPQLDGDFAYRILQCIEHHRNPAMIDLTTDETLSQATTEPEEQQDLEITL